jgi:surface polysaccharide O-acyltransferase-like enzyme
MCLLFVIAGMSSRYSLQKRTYKEFLKDRSKRILVPSIIGIFVYGWISSLITSQYTDMFAGNGDMIPSVIKYFIYCLMGIGPLWFCHVLFIGCVLVVAIRKIDKKDKIWELCGKTGYVAFVLLTFLVWASSLILNTPLITVYRFGIYLLMYFLGYFLFSHNDVLDKLGRVSVFMGVFGMVIGFVYVVNYYGTNYTADSCLHSLFTNVYLWIMILAILGLGYKFLNFENRFSNYMTKNNFSFYVLHYTIVVVIGYLTVTYLNLPFALYYIIIALGVTCVLPILVEIIKRVPIINKLVLGI